MAIIIAEGVVEVTGDGRGVTKQIARDIDGNGAPVEQAGQGLGRKLIGGLLAIGAVAGVSSWLKGAVDGASDLNETVSKSSAIFGSGAKEIDKWGDRAAVNVGLSKSAAMAAAAGFGDMFLQLGFTSSAAVDMSKSVVQAAADLGSFSNLETADVSERISAAFRGEYDSLQAVIPNINAARVEQEALAASGKKTTKELTAQDKATAVLAIVHKDGARAMGDFAKTSDGFANQNKIATAQLADMQAEVGTALLPTMQGFMGFMLTSVIPGFKGAAEWVGKNIDTVLMLSAVVAGTAAAFGIATVAGSIYKAYQIAAAASTGGLTVAQWALNAAMSANPIGIIIVALGALVAGIVWVATQTTFFQDTWANVTSFVGTAVEWLGGVFDTVMAGIGAVFTWLNDNVVAPVAAGISASLTWLGDAVTTIGNGIGAVFSWLYNTIIVPVATGIMIYVGLVAAVYTWLWQSAVMPAINGIGWLIGWLYNSVIVPIGVGINIAIGAIGAAFGWLYNTIIVPIGAGIMGYLRLVGGVYTWLWQNVVVPAINGIGAVFGWLYNTLIVPIGKGIMASINTVGGVFTWLWRNAAMPAINGIGAGFRWVWESVISPVGRTISEAIGHIGKTVGDVFRGIPKVIGGAFQAALGVVRGPINGLIGLVNGVISGINSIKVTIPSWVPIVGGQTFGLTIPHLPRLALGSNSAPDAFIAGEAGPELITGARGATVRPYSVTQDLLSRSSGSNITIGSVVLDAKNVKEFTDIVELLKALPQVARAGRGTSVKVGA